MPSFMQPSVVESDWLEFDTHQGIFAVDASYLPGIVAAFSDESIEDILEHEDIASPALDYLECSRIDQITNIELKHGFGARMSAPGYTDCTYWTVFPTAAEAEAYLREYYMEDDEDESEAEDETNA